MACEDENQKQGDYTVWTTVATVRESGLGSGTGRAIKRELPTTELPGHDGTWYGSILYCLSEDGARK